MTATEQIAARILDEEIRQLTELKRMASNPRLFEFMRQIVNAAGGDNHNGKAPSKRPETTIKRKTSTAPNGVTECVMIAAESLKTDFSIADIVHAMQAAGFEFVAKSPKVAVGDVVRRYTGKVFHVRTHGTGNQPSKFDFKKEPVMNGHS